MSEWEKYLNTIADWTAADTWNHVVHKCACDSRNPEEWEDGVFLTKLPIRMTDLLFAAGITESKGEAKRLIKQAGIKVISTYGKDNKWTAAKDEIIDKLPTGGILVMKGKKQ